MPNSSRDCDAIAVLQTRPHPAVTVATGRAFGFFGVLKQMYTKVGPEMPEGLEATPYPSGLSDPTAETMLYNWDEGHAGRFSVEPALDKGASLAFDYVHAKPDPFSYIREHLHFAAPCPAPTPDVVMFSPGLNTLHQPTATETSTPQRLAHYIRVLMRVPMAQLHTGTQMDQGTAVVDASNAPLLRLLLSLFGWLIPEDVRPKQVDGTLEWDARTLDSMQTALSQVNLIDTPLKQSFRALLQSTRDAATAHPFTLVVYSRGSVEVCAALHKHYEESRDEGEWDSQIFARLRKYVTIVTVGPAVKGFADGPAYVHLSAWADPLSATVGVDGRNQWGAGRDAVFVNCATPYNESSFDNHNFGALTAQWLAVVMHLNGAATLHALWEKGCAGKLKGVADEVSTLAALIELTDGRRWLWVADDSMKDVPADRFPERETAKQIVREQVDEEFLNSVLEAFPDE